MKSPFDIPEITPYLLTFNIPKSNGEISVDPLTGVQKIEEDTLILSCYLKASSKYRYKDVELPGVNGGSQYFEGWIISKTLVNSSGTVVTVKTIFSYPYFGFNTAVEEITSGDGGSIESEGSLDLLTTGKTGRANLTQTSIEGEWIHQKVIPSSYPEVRECVGDRISGFINFI